MKCTPDYLRGTAVANIIGTMQNVHMGGTWALMDVNTYNGLSTLEFAVGTIDPETLTDERQKIRITVEEL